MSQHCNICKHIISKYQAVNCVHFFTEKKITLKFLPTFLHSVLWGTALILNSSEKTYFVMLTITTILLNFICIKYWGFFLLNLCWFSPRKLKFAREMAYVKSKEWDIQGNISLILSFSCYRHIHSRWLIPQKKTMKQTCKLKRIVQESCETKTVIKTLFAIAVRWGHSFIKRAW